ncbi:MAG: amino acid ABC transporter permease [Thermicanus sp.]|nr:amino acid ABC transporter permease [Thermicanus sp.]
MEGLPLIDFRWDIVWAYRALFLNGIWLTILFTVVGIAFGLILGLLFGLGKISKYKMLSMPSILYITFFRGTPLYVQILLIHFAVIPSIFGESKGPVFSGMVALSLNSGAYIAEIFRAGIQSIGKGQMEAARSLGLTHGQAMTHIILPQAFKRMIPPLGNEFIALLKDSSLLAAISAPELANASRIIQGSTLRPWEAYFPAAVLYLILTLILSRIVHGLERRFSNEGRTS